MLQRKFVSLRWLVLFCISKYEPVATMSVMAKSKVKMLDHAYYDYKISMKIFYENILWKYFVKIFCENILWKYFVKIFCENILWKYFVKIFCENILWKYFVKIFCENILWKYFVKIFCENILWKYFVKIFCENILWKYFVKIFCENILWKYFVKIFCENILWKYARGTASALVQRDFSSCTFSGSRNERDNFDWFLSSQRPAVSFLHDDAARIQDCCSVRSCALASQTYVTSKYSNKLHVDLSWFFIIV